MNRVISNFSEDVKTLKKVKNDLVKSIDASINDVKVKILNDVKNVVTEEKEKVEKIKIKNKNVKRKDKIVEYFEERRDDESSSSSYSTEIHFSFEASASFDEEVMLSRDSSSSSDSSFSSRSEPVVERFSEEEEVIEVDLSCSSLPIENLGKSEIKVDIKTDDSKKKTKSSIGDWSLIGYNDNDIDEFVENVEKHESVVLEIPDFSKEEKVDMVIPNVYVDQKNDYRMIDFEKRTNGNGIDLLNVKFSRDTVLLMSKQYLGPGTVRKQVEGVVNTNDSCSILDLRKVIGRQLVGEKLFDGKKGVEIKNFLHKRFDSEFTLLNYGCGVDDITDRIEGAKILNVDIVKRDVKNFKLISQLDDSEVFDVQLFSVVLHHIKELSDIKLLSKLVVVRDFYCSSEKELNAATIYDTIWPEDSLTECSYVRMLTKEEIISLFKNRGYELVEYHEVFGSKLICIFSKIDKKGFRLNEYKGSDEMVGIVWSGLFDYTPDFSWCCQNRTRCKHSKSAGQYQNIVSDIQKRAISNTKVITDEESVGSENAQLRISCAFRQFMRIRVPSALKKVSKRITEVIVIIKSDGTPLRGAFFNLLIVMANKHRNFDFVLFEADEDEDEYFDYPNIYCSKKENFVSLLNSCDKPYVIFEFCSQEVLRNIQLYRMSSSSHCLCYSSSFNYREVPDRTSFPILNNLVFESFSNCFMRFTEYYISKNVGITPFNSTLNLENGKYFNCFGRYMSTICMDCSELTLLSTFLKSNEDIIRGSKNKDK